MKAYFKIIKYLQEILLVISIAIIIVLPTMIVFYPEIIRGDLTQKLYDISHIFIFFVMMIRPLADIFIRNKWIRPLVILRKGMGVLSASIIVSFIIAKLMIDPMAYFNSIGTVGYWSFTNYAIFAHLADLTAIILIVTSNNLSKRLLGNLWKNVQKLSYIYFYGGSLYVYLSYKSINILFSLILVTLVTYLAFIMNKRRLAQNPV